MIKIDGNDCSILSVLRDHRLSKNAVKDLFSKLSPAAKKIAATIPIRYLSKAAAKRIDKLFYILTGHV